MFTAGQRQTGGAIEIPGGRGLLGTQTPFISVDGEGPLRKVQIKPFLMGATTVTQADFAAFVDALSLIHI